MESLLRTICVVQRISRFRHERKDLLLPDGFYQGKNLATGCKRGLIRCGPLGDYQDEGLDSNNAAEMLRAV